MSAVEQVADPAVRQLKKIPPFLWFAIAVILGLMVLIWHRFGCDPEDTDWLDPGQPPMSLPVDFTTTLAGVSKTAPGAPDGGCRPHKKYPAPSLLHLPCCWVGDC